jgi:aminopeptidase N
MTAAWLRQTGYPLVSVVYDDIDNMLIVRQLGRFVLNRTAHVGAPASVWPIPCAVNVDGATYTMWLMDNSPGK